MICISHEWYRSSHGKVHVVVSSIMIVHRYIVHCFTQCVIWKSFRWTCNRAQFESLCFMSSNWTITLWKHPTTFVVWKVKVQLIAVIRWFKTFCLGCKKPDNETRSGRLTTIDPEGVLQTIEASQVSSTKSIKWA